MSALLTLLDGSPPWYENPANLAETRSYGYMMPSTLQDNLLQRYVVAPVGGRLAETTFGGIYNNFGRPSAAVYTNSAGDAVSVGNNIPRFPYDPMTLQPRGFLPEQQSTNLVGQSNGLDTSAWTKAGISSISSTQNIKGYQYQNLVIDAANSVHEMYGTGVSVNRFNFTPGVNYAGSALIRRNNYRYHQVSAGAIGQSSDFGCTFDWQTNSIVAQGVTGAVATLVRAYIVAQIDADTYIIGFVGSFSDGAIATVGTQYRTTPTFGTPQTFTGNGISAISIGEFSFEEGEYVTTLKRSNGSKTTRAADFAHATNIPWHNPNALSGVITCRIGDGMAFSMGGGTMTQTPYRMHIQAMPNQVGIFMLNNGVTVIGVNSVVARNRGDMVKIGFSIGPLGAIFVVNGALIGSTAVNGSNMLYGHAACGFRYLSSAAQGWANQEIADVKTWAGDLTQAELIKRTA